MRAPRVVAKGARLNAQKIRQLAARHQVPILENKPLARFMFKHCKVGGEIPAQLFAAVAEILAWVYRINRYRYYTQEHRQPDTPASRPAGGLGGATTAGKLTSV
jgi:flagellar biosynthetic protein FlhB